MDTRSDDMVGEYPYYIEDRPDETVVHFKSKKNPSKKGPVFNLRFHVTSSKKRARIKEIFAELSDIDR